MKGYYRQHLFYARKLLHKTLNYKYQDMLQKKVISFYYLIFMIQYIHYILYGRNEFWKTQYDIVLQYQSG